MAYTVFIDGAEGTTGLRLHQRLASQGDIEVLTLPDAERKHLPSRLAAMVEADVTMLCLPDAAAAEIAQAAPENARICDASTAHRTSWVYGFPELGGRRSRIAGAKRVAVPGCHASGFLALVAPLVEKGLLDHKETLACHSLTGYSGGGKQMIAAYEAPDRPTAYEAPRQYGLGLAHKHLPEMQLIANLVAPPLFSPIVADFYSGMLVSVPLAAHQLAEEARNPAALAQFYREYYAGQPLVTIKTAQDTPQDGTLSAGAMAGRDDMEIFVLGNERQLLLCARFDNLGKGASGAALQCLNLMLGRDELAGLVTQ